MERCLYYNSWNCFDCLLRTYGDSSLSEPLPSGITIMDLASSLNVIDTVKSIANTFTDGVSLEDFTVYNQGFEKKTLIPFDDSFYQHAGFNENRESRLSQQCQQMEHAGRLEILHKEPHGIFHSDLLKDQVVIIDDFQDAQLSDVTLTHDSQYVLSIKDFCETIAPGSLGYIDGDTTVSRESWKASLRATGAVIEACKQILEGKGRNGFCPVRPPGHHAGIFGQVDLCDKEISSLKKACPGY